MFLQTSKYQSSLDTQTHWSTWNQRTLYFLYSLIPNRIPLCTPNLYEDTCSIITFLTIASSFVYQIDAGVHGCDSLFVHVDQQHGHHCHDGPYRPGHPGPAQLQRRLWTLPHEPEKECHSTPGTWGENYHHLAKCSSNNRGERYDWCTVLSAGPT